MLGRKYYIFASNNNNDPKRPKIGNKPYYNINGACGAAYKYDFYDSLRENRKSL